ncbi:alpha/beta hydrolase [Cupriavidus pauculus]|uniref:Alpha/beta hydrolase fold-3 domain-containing protein n=1 Tax=Cupriavidus pauculus TaxID=82633 RepID=A0A3G8H7B0_9BURK|nr:alpha/beta hydrolase fold domain-containing protein [Cupriavidus pauculus]AZG16421.1 hypothetical protein EHF44_23835 [Cupriavidus pauculus]
MLVLDYPLAPEQALPVAHDIALTAVKWLVRQDVRRLAIVGDSAGGGLGSEELLRDDALRYAGQARAQGNTVTLEIWQGLHHVFHFNVAELESARIALDRVAAFVVEHL